MRSSKWNVRSGRTVTRAGIGMPGVMCAVRALNSCLGLENNGAEVAIECHYLAEINTLYAFATQCRTNWWTGVCLASSDYELDH